MLLPFQGANGVVASYPGGRSLWSLALGWEVLPFQGVNGGVAFHLLLNNKSRRYMRYAGGIYPTCGLMGQKRLAQGKANNVSRHPGYSVSASAWRPERAKDLRRYAEICTIN